MKNTDYTLDFPAPDGPAMSQRSGGLGMCPKRLPLASQWIAWAGEIAAGCACPCGILVPLKKAMSFPLLGQSGGADLSAVEADIATLQTDVALKADSSSVYTQAESDAISQALTTTLANGLALKQDVIQADDLALTDTASLVSELASKALQTDLVSGLAGKQPTITTGSLAISDVASLQTSLDQKALQADLLSAGETINTALAGKEDTLGATIGASTFQFEDVDALGINTLLLKGGSMGLAVRDSANNSLIDADNTAVIVTPTLNAAGGIVGSTITNINNRLAALESKPYFDGIANADSANFTTQSRIVPINSVRTTTASDFTLESGGPLRFNTAGTYLIIYRLSTDVASGNNRSIAKGVLQRSINGGNYTQINGSNVFCYNRDATNGENTAACSVVLSMNANDRVRIVASRHAGTDTLRCLGNACGITAIAL